MLMADGPIDLLSKARAGETEALGELCALYRNYLRMVVRTGLGPRLRERVEMSDVVQEVLVEVVRQFPQFTGQNEAALVGWLRRLVGQKLADLGRYHSRAKRAGASTAVAARWRRPTRPAGVRPGRRERPAAGHAGAFSQTSPSQAVSRREQIVLLADALAALADCRGRCPLASLRREPLVRGDRRAGWPLPKVDPRHLGARVETPETLAGRAARRPAEV